VPATVTVEQIADAQAGIALDAIRQQAADRYNDVVARIDSGELTTWDAARAAFLAGVGQSLTRREIAQRRIEWQRTLPKG
jgi:hypothetical protein